MMTTSEVVLTEGGMVERINRSTEVNLDPYIAHAGLVYETKGREVLTRIYTEYIDIAQKQGVPMLSLAATWRANPERIAQSAFSHKDNINKDCVDFLKDIRATYGQYARQIFIGGLLACKGDAYLPREALTKEEAATFHDKQVRQLTESGVDFIKAATLPAFSEAYGIAQAIAKHNIPYILSFVVTPKGTLLDGTPIQEAIELIDAEINPRPAFYMINCVHPSIFAQAIDDSSSIKERVLGLQANTSAKTPEELNNLKYLDASSTPEEFGDLMISLHHRYGLKVLGGCCGSDANHIKAIAGQLK